MLAVQRPISRDRGGKYLLLVEILIVINNDFLTKTAKLGMELGNGELRINHKEQKN